jgi:Conserved TM helix
MCPWRAIGVPLNSTVRRLLEFVRMFPAVRDSSEALFTSVAGGMALSFSALPRVLAAVTIFAAGWYLASLLARIVSRLLSRAHFAELPATPYHLALATKWLVRLLALFVAFDALGVPAVTDLLRQMLLWLPHLAVGVVVLLAASYLANAAARLAAGAARSAGLRNSGLVSVIVRVAVWAFAAIIALHEVGVGDELVHTLFAGVVAVGVVAGGLALGLGGQDIAAGMVARWYGASRGAVDKIAAATDQRKARREFEPETLARRWKHMGLPAGTRLRAARKRGDRRRVAEDDVFKELTVETAEMAQELVIAKHARVVDEVRVRVDVSAHEEKVQATVRDIEASVERFRI